MRAKPCTLAGLFHVKEHCVIITILSMAFVLGLLVTVHEAGHFIAAKRVGVRVYEFAIGFGKVLYSRRVGETKYQLRLLPFGGFVSMRGEDIEDPAKLYGPPLPPAHEDPESLASKTVAERFSVFFAGPLMNLLTAMALIFLVSLIGAPQPAYLAEPALVNWVHPESAAAEAGIVQGDTVSAVNGKAVANWEEFATAMASNTGEEVELAVNRAGQQRTFKVTPTSESPDEGSPFAGIFPNASTKIASVFASGAAGGAGMQAGDEVVAVAGAEVAGWGHLIYLIQEHADTPVTYTVRRATESGSELVDLTIASEVDSSGVAKLGITPDPRVTTKRYGLMASLYKGLVEPFEVSWQILSGIGGLITGEHSVKSMGGPIMIANAAGSIASNNGFISLLDFTAFISLNFFVLNLLPIPVLDGGHILFLLPEIVTGQQPSQRIREWFLTIGLVILLSLMAFVTLIDIGRFTGLLRMFGL